VTQRSRGEDERGEGEQSQEIPRRLGKLLHDRVGPEADRAARVRDPAVHVLLHVARPAVQDLDRRVGEALESGHVPRPLGCARCAGIPVDPVGARGDPGDRDRGSRGLRPESDELARVGDVAGILERQHVGVAVDDGSLRLGDEEEDRIGARGARAEGAGEDEPGERTDLSAR
jgi:hypothetical protein